MHLEVEQKFPLADPVDATRRLTALGASWGPTLAERDQYYAHPARDFAATDEALRIRRADDGIHLAYKGPKLDPLTKTRRELEIALPGPAEAARWTELLDALGFRPVAEVSKRRRRAWIEWAGRQIQACLDEVEGVGAYLELELLVADDPVELGAARETIAALAEQLGLLTSERRSYLELLLLGRGAETR